MTIGWPAAWNLGNWWTGEEDEDVLDGDELWFVLGIGEVYGDKGEGLGVNGNKKPWRSLVKEGA